MQQAIAQFGSRTSTPTDGVQAAHGSSRRHKYLMPATVLAFLLAVVISMLVARGVASVQNHATTEQTLTNTLKQEDNKNLESNETSSEQAASVNTKATIDNGQANVKVEVNGQELPVSPNESVHRTVTNNGTTTTIDIQTNAIQSGDAAQSFGSNNTSSFSTSFQSSTVISSQH